MFRYIKRYIDSSLKHIYRESWLSLFKVWRKYLKDYNEIKRNHHSNSNFELMPSYPCISDNIDSSGEFGRYVYQDSWAYKHLLNVKPKKLVDIASSTYFVAFAAQCTKVESVDIRLLKAKLPSIKPIRGDILNLPYKSKSIEAISSLSVIEHIGLGRYGDKINIDGMKGAINEMKRVLSPKGMMLVAFPVGKESIIHFNAHRICTPELVYEMFSDLNIKDEKYALRDEIVSKERFEKLKRPYSYGCYYLSRE